MIKLFRLILSEVDRLLQLCFCNSVRDIINKNYLRGLLDMSKLNEEENMKIKCEHNKITLKICKIMLTKCDDEIFRLLSNFLKSR